jgi:saccharopine dehydrogenase (NADP+, L-glutamate forming)
LQVAQKLAIGFPRTQAIALDVTSEVDLDKHIAAHDVVISLIPYIYHASVIKSAIKSGTNVVTTSYISDAI